MFGKNVTTIVAKLPKSGPIVLNTRSPRLFHRAVPPLAPHFNTPLSAGAELFVLPVLLVATLQPVLVFLSGDKSSAGGAGTPPPAPLPWHGAIWVRQSRQLLTVILAYGGYAFLTLRL